MAEADVTLTDYALTVECGILVWLLLQKLQPPSSVRAWSVLFFAAAGIAALAGGTDHGFAAGERSDLHFYLRVATYAAIGLAAFAAWGIGSALLESLRARQFIRLVALFAFAGYLVATPFVDSFLLPIAHYLPAALFLLIVYAMRYRESRAAGFALGAIGLLLTFVAAGVQQGGIALNERWFDHNALYHLIQGIGLGLLYLASLEAARRARTFELGCRRRRGRL